MIFAKRLPKTEVNIFTSVFSGVLSIWEIHSMRLPLWRGQELYSQDYTKCPLYGTSHTAVCGQESPALLRGTKFAEPNCFIHGAWILLTCAMQENETLENIQENNCKLCCMATQWPFGFFSEQHPTRLCTRSPESACRSTIATGQPITRLLTFQETDMQHDTRPDESTERLLGGLPTISRCPAGTETLWSKSR